MSRLSTPAVDSATGATAELFAQIKKAAGKVPNTYAAIGAHGTAALKIMLQADAVLAAGTLSKQDQETIKLAVSAAVGCDYCEAAHSVLGKFAGLQPDVLKRIHDQRGGVLGHQGRRLHRRAAGGHQPGPGRDHLHKRLQPHQQHHARLPGGRLTRLPRAHPRTRGRVGAINKGVQP